MCLSHYDYGFRIYNPSIARFLSVDPLRYSYPELTPYQFASNTPIWASDLDGLEAEYRTDGSIHFKLRDGDGYTQVVDELGLDGILITWTDLRDKNPETACHIDGCERDDPGNRQYNGNTRLNEGEYLFVGFYDVAEPVVPISDPKESIIPQVIGITSDGVGGLGAGFSIVGGNFSLRSAGRLSPKFYSDKFYGNQYRSVTSSMKIGTTLGRLGTAGTIGLGVYDIGTNYSEENGVGVETSKAIGRTTGSLFAGGFGGKLGGGIGFALAGPPGALGGGIAGSIIFSYLGSMAGEKIAEKTYETLDETTKNNEEDKN